MDRWLVILMLGQLAFVGFIIWMAFRAREARVRQRAEERARVLERFSSGQEVTEFLSSSAGTRYMNLLGERASHPIKSIAATVVAGIISIFAGGAFEIVSKFVQDSDRIGFRIAGTLGLVGGVGILVAAIISAALYRYAGLMPPRARRDGPGEES
ncbi:MAG TPA: hypothetical protein VH394_12900 [Thermoanaerobaculia bacterium]|jgi:hypothetical protein|nr:hypothetical protein [Thermoanaerobaculia bacterium]